MPPPSSSPLQPSVASRVEDVAISTRCSFETLDAFRHVEDELRSPEHHESHARDISRRPTKFSISAVTATLSSSASPVPFHTTVRTESAYELKTEAARRNDHIKTPYKTPSDYCHRPESPATTWSTPGTDFLAKFCLPDTQELRRRIALDQEGFFTDGSPSSPVKMSAATSLVKSDQPGVRIKSSTRPGSPTQAFESRVPRTSRKSANTALRLEKIVDQDGLLPQLHDIRLHQYREEPHSAVVRFKTTFKPASSRRSMGDI